MSIAPVRFQLYNSFRQKNNYVIVISVLLISLVVVKDVLHAYLKNYSFYISESLLFGMFWMLFIPLVLYYIKSIRKAYFPFSALGMSLFHIASFASIVSLISYLFMDHGYDGYQIFIDTAARYGIVCLATYLACSLFQHEIRDPLILDREERAVNKISVINGDTTKVVSIKDIIYVSSEKPYIAIMTGEGKFLQANSLKNFLVRSNTDFMIRIHKSVIINKNHIVSYTSRKNGDYDIKLSNNKNVRASRSYRHHFKPLFDQLSSTT